MADKAVGTRLRKLAAPLPEYLLSRSVAGATHKDIMAAVEQLTEGEVVSRFYPMYPALPPDLLSWFKDWIKRGAVPLATLNLQKAVPPGMSIPDAWHHQTVFGVTSDGVYLTNPLELSKFSVIQQQLCSESVLLIRREDILSRWSPEIDLGPVNTEQEWQELNVAKNITKMVSEFASTGTTTDSHLVIPAVYKSGIALFALRGSPCAQRLLSEC